MEEVHHPAYSKLQEIGRQITTHVKPKAVVVFSAHWAEERYRSGQHRRTDGLDIRVGRRKPLVTQEPFQNGQQSASYLWLRH